MIADNLPDILNIGVDAIVLGLVMALAKIHLSALDKMAQRLDTLSESWHKLCLEMQEIKLRITLIEKLGANEKSNDSQS